MKKALTIIAVVLAAISCSKSGEGSSSVLPGTNWETTDGKTKVSFTETTITIKDDTYGTSSSSYTVTAEQQDVASYFNITDLKRGDETYTTGAAYIGNKTLVLNGPIGCTYTLRCYRK